MYKEWLNKQETTKEVLTDSLAFKFENTLSLGIDLPNLLGLHWCVTQPGEPRSNLSKDGHIKRGNFFPPIELPQRMWASSKINFYHKLIFNEEVERNSEIVKIELKESKNSGELYFVYLKHNYFQKKELILDETQTLVYKNPSLRKESLIEKIDNNEKLFEIVPDNLMLFRFSALTFNSHRIHYDKDYALNEENYPELVVQGPLIASIAMNLIQSKNPKKDLKNFEFNIVSPSYVNNGLHIYANDNSVKVLGDENQILMSGLYQF
ncbi:MAG: hypothetical protein ACJ0HU_04680 [Gammaproteobacteria bacterium]